MNDVALQRIAGKAVIVNDEGKILFLREATTYEEGTNTGRYQSPGGRVNMGEPFMDALKREVMEETGLEIEVVRPIFVGEWFPVIKGVKNQIVAIFYICKPLSTDVRLSEEHDAFAWIDPKQPLEIDIMDPEPEMIKAYLDLI